MRDEERLMPVAKAFEGETGHRPHPTTLWRFYTTGSKGRILKTWKVGGRRMTSMAAVREFVAATTKQSITGVSDALAKELA